MTSKSIQAARLALETLDAAKRARDFAVECVKEEIAERVRAAMEGCPGNVCLINLFKDGTISMQEEHWASIICFDINTTEKSVFLGQSSRPEDYKSLPFVMNPDVLRVMKEAIAAAKEADLFRESCNVPVTFNKK